MKRYTAEHTLDSSDAGEIILLGDGSNGSFFTISALDSVLYVDGYGVRLVNVDALRGKRIAIAGIGNIVLNSGQEMALFKASTGWGYFILNRARSRTGTPVFEVGGPNSDVGGSDTGNDGLGLDAPFATINGALNAVKGGWDLGGNNTIASFRLWGSSYAEGIHLASPGTGMEGGGRFHIFSADGLTYRPLITTASMETIGVYTGANLRVEGVALQCNEPNHSCINASLGGNVFVRNVLFYNAGMYQIAAADFGRVEIEMDPDPAKDASCFLAAGGHKAFMWCGPDGRIVYRAPRLNITGGVSMSEAFVECDGGKVDVFTSIVGGSSCAGPRYLVRNNGVIRTASGSETYLPGTTAGTKSNGGQYVAA